MSGAAAMDVFRATAGRLRLSAAAPLRRAGWLPPAATPKVPMGMFQREAARSACTRSNQVVRLAAMADSESLPTRRLNRKGVDDSVFDDLGLKEVYGEVGGIRTRQHVNPLKRELQVVMPPPKWEEVFEDPSLPLTVDIGCGPGRFLLMMAKGSGGGANFLGLEIRAKMVDRAIEWADKVGLSECTHFMPANATVSFESILSTYPGRVDLVCIQCPDPHFKKRHHKRRIVQPALVDMVKGAVSPGGRVFLQSDVEEVGIAMRDQFERYGSDVLSLHPLHAETGVEYEPIPEGVLTGVAEVQRAARAKAAAQGSTPEQDGGDDDDAWTGGWGEEGGWLPENPLGIPTEREQYALSLRHGRMHRVLLVKDEP